MFRDAAVAGRYSLVGNSLLQHTPFPDTCLVASRAQRALLYDPPPERAATTERLIQDSTDATPTGHQTRAGRLSELAAQIGGVDRDFPFRDAQLPSSHSGSDHGAG